MSETTTTWIQEHLDQIAAGEDHTLAVDSLLQRASQRIHRIVRSAMQSRPGLGRWETDEDVLQEVLLRLDRAVRDAKPESPGQFFIIVAQHVRWATLDLARQHFGPEGYGRNHRTAGAAGGKTAGAPDPNDENTLSSLDLVRLHEAVDKLDPDERDTWHLCRYLGMSQEVAAQQLGVSAKTIQRRILRAKRRLAAELDDLRPG